MAFAIHTVTSQPIKLVEYSKQDVYILIEKLFFLHTSFGGDAIVNGRGKDTGA